MTKIYGIELFGGEYDDSWECIYERVFYQSREECENVHDKLEKSLDIINNNIDEYGSIKKLNIDKSSDVGKLCDEYCLYFDKVFSQIVDFDLK